jgi:hypothetical protein
MVGAIEEEFGRRGRPSRNAKNAIFEHLTHAARTYGLDPNVIVERQSNSFGGLVLMGWTHDRNPHERSLLRSALHVM